MLGYSDMVRARDTPDLVERRAQDFAPRERVWTEAERAERVGRLDRWRRWAAEQVGAAMAAWDAEAVA